MILSLLLATLSVSAELTRDAAGTLGKIPSLTFDLDDPIASHPEMIKIATDIYERNMRRGLSNPNQFDDTDRRLMLDLHNQIRSEVARGVYEGPGGSFQPAGCDMNALSWSTALETLATEWSDLCYFSHSNDCATRMTNLGLTGSDVEWNRQTDDDCGENLFVSGASPAMNAVHEGTNYGILGGIGESWSAHESKAWSYQKGNGNHYTQVVWANTRYVGCGFKTCNGVRTVSDTLSWASTMFTCNYYPRGNYDNQYPYTAGPACGCCDSDRHACTHDGGLCGGGWNSNYNNDHFHGDRSGVDWCYDGTGRNVCDDAGLATDSTNSGATSAPTTSPTARPSGIPTSSPTKMPMITPVENSESSDGEAFAVQVTTVTTWVSHQNDFADVDHSIEDLLFEQLQAPYLDVTASIGADGKYMNGPQSNDEAYWGTVGTPILLQQVSASNLEDIEERVNDGTFQDELCASLTDMYSDGSGESLECAQVSATVDSVTISEYQAFIGDENGDGIPFDSLNLETYSASDIFVLIVFLTFICVGCWCLGWYAHKRKFKNDLQRELNVASNFKPAGTATNSKRGFAKFSPQT